MGPGCRHFRKRPARAHLARGWAADSCDRLQESGVELRSAPAGWPFGDTGAIVHPPAGGANGLYTVNDDCTGSIHFLDANGVTWNFVVDPAQAAVLWMIQVNPANNVFQGSARPLR